MNSGFGLLLVGVAVSIVVGEFALDFWGKYRRFRPQRGGAPRTGLVAQARYWLDRRLHPNYYRVDLPLIRDFVGNLQLAMSLEETLSGALIRTAEQFQDRGIFGVRLMRHVRSRLTIAPDAVIAALAKDFNSPELDNVVLRLDLARDSGLTAVDALNVSLEEIEHKIQMALERDIQRSPIYLTIPMVVGVFFATLALAAYPLVRGLLQTITLE